MKFRNVLLYLLLIFGLLSCGQEATTTKQTNIKKSNIKQSNYWIDLAAKSNLNSKQIQELKKISVEYEGYRNKQQKQLSRKLNEKELKLWRSKKFLTIERRMGKAIKDKVYEYNKFLTIEKNN